MPRWVLERPAKSVEEGLREQSALGEIAVEGATPADLWRALERAVEGAG